MEEVEQPQQQQQQQLPPELEQRQRRILRRPLPGGHSGAAATAAAAAALRGSRRGRGRPRRAGGAMATGEITTLPANSDDTGGFPPGSFKDPKRLYCKNGGFFLRINSDGRVDGVREKSDPHSKCSFGSSRFLLRRQGRRGQTKLLYAILGVAGNLILGY